MFLTCRSCLHGGEEAIDDGPACGVSFSRHAIVEAVRMTTTIERARAFCVKNEVSVYSTTRLASAIGIAVLIASQAYAEPPQNAIPTVSPAQATPTDILAYYPPGPRAAGVEGHATITCASLEHGALRECILVSEQPAGQGFGAAALALAEHAAQGPTLPAQMKTPGLRLPFEFKLRPPSITPNVLEAPHLSPPYWLKQPSGDDVARVYPSKERRVGNGARAELICKFEADGRLADCTATANPPKLGFEEAALKLAPLFKAHGPMIYGQAIRGEGTVHIPIRFLGPGQ
jgi:TonB family protein